MISFRSHVWPIADLSVSPIHSSALYAGMRIDAGGFMGIVRGPTRLSSPAWLDGPVLLGLQLTLGRHEEGRHVAFPQPTRRPIQDLFNHRLHDGCIGFPSPALQESTVSSFGYRLSDLRRSEQVDAARSKRIRTVSQKELLAVLQVVAEGPEPRGHHGALSCEGLQDLDTRTSSDSDRKSTRLNSSHLVISYAVFCL